MNKVLHPFSPVINEYSKVLILGSFPSVVSRKNNFYYGNKNNRFYKILNSLFNLDYDLNLKSNDFKKNFLLEHKIALFDVVKSCEIIKSYDNSINSVEYNDIENIIKNSKISLIILNGEKAYKLFLNYLVTHKIKVKYIKLPSTSSANAKASLESLIKSYAVILNYL